MARSNFNKVLEEALRSYVDNLHTDWDEWLDCVEFAHNGAIVSTRAWYVPIFTRLPLRPIVTASQTLRCFKFCHSELNLMKDAQNHARSHVQVVNTPYRGLPNLNMLVN